MKVSKCLQGSHLWKQQLLPLVVVVDKFDSWLGDSLFNHPSTPIFSTLHALFYEATVLLLQHSVFQTTVFSQHSPHQQSRNCALFQKRYITVLFDTGTSRGLAAFPCRENSRLGRVSLPIALL